MEDNKKPAYSSRANYYTDDGKIDINAIAQSGFAAPRDANYNVQTALSNTKPDVYTKPYASVTLNEKTGAVNISAPSEFLNSDVYKETYKPELEYLSSTYRKNPDYATTLDVKETNDKGETVTVTKTIKDYVDQLNNVDNGLPAAAKSYLQRKEASRTYSKIELGLSDQDIIDGKGYNDYEFALRMSMVGKNVLGDNVYDNAIQVLPINVVDKAGNTTKDWNQTWRSLAANAGVSGEYDSKSGTITRKGWRAIWDRSDTHSGSMSDESLLALYDLVKDSLDEAKKNGDKEQVARCSALIQTMKDEAPDVDFWEGLGDQLGAFFGGAGTAMAKEFYGGGAIAAGAGITGGSGGAALGALIGSFAGPIGTAVGGVAGALIGAVTGSFAGGSIEDTIKKINEEDPSNIFAKNYRSIDALSKDIKENLELLNPNAVFMNSVGSGVPEGVYLAMSIYSGNLMEKSVEKAGSTIVKNNKFLNTVYKAHESGKITKATQKTLTGTYGMLKTLSTEELTNVINLVYGTSKVLGKTISLVAETIGEVTVNSPDLMYRIITSGKLDDDARNNLLNEFAWNAGGWMAFGTLGKANELWKGKTKTGKLVNDWFSREIMGLSVIGADIQNVIRKIFRQDIDSIQNKLSKLGVQVEDGVVKATEKQLADNKISRLFNQLQELGYRQQITRAKDVAIAISLKESSDVAKETGNIFKGLKSGLEKFDDARIDYYIKTQNIIQDVIENGKKYTGRYIFSDYGKSFIKANTDSFELLKALKNNDPSYSLAKVISGDLGEKTVIDFGTDVNNYLSMVSNTQKLAKMELAGVEGSAVQKQLKYEQAKMAEFEAKYGEEVSSAAKNLVNSIQKATADFYDFGIKEGVFNKAQIEELRRTGLWGEGGTNYMELRRADAPLTTLQNNVQRELDIAKMDSATGAEQQRAVLGTIDKDYRSPMDVLYSRILSTSGHIAKNAMVDNMRKLGIIKASDLVASIGDTEAVRIYKDLHNESVAVVKRGISNISSSQATGLTDVIDRSTESFMKAGKVEFKLDEAYGSIHTKIKDEKTGAKKTVIKYPKVKVMPEDISDTVDSLGSKFDDVCRSELNATFEPEEVYDMLIDFQKNGGNIETTLLDETYSPIQELISESDGSKRAFNQFYKNLSSEQQEELARRIQTRGEGMQQEILSKKDYIAQSDAQKALDEIQDTVKNTPAKIKELDGNISKIEGQIAEESKKIPTVNKATGLSATESKELKKARESLESFEDKMTWPSIKNDKNAMAKISGRAEELRVRISELESKSRGLDKFLSERAAESSKVTKKEAEAAKKKVSELKSKLNNLKNERNSLNKDLAKAKKNLAAAKEKVKTVGAGYNDYVNKLTKENAKAMEVSYGNVIGLTQNAKGAKNALKVKSLDKAIGDSSRRVSVETFAERYANMTSAQKEIMQSDMRKAYGEKLKKTEYIKNLAKNRKQVGTLFFIDYKYGKLAGEADELANTLRETFYNPNDPVTANAVDEIIDGITDVILNEKAYGGSGNAIKVFETLAGSPDRTSHAVMASLADMKINGEKASDIIYQKVNALVRKRFKEYAENQYKINKEAAEKAGKKLEFKKSDYVAQSEAMADEFTDVFKTRFDAKVADSRTALQDAGMISSGSDDLFDEEKGLISNIESKAKMQKEMDKSMKGFVLSGGNIKDSKGYVKRLVDNGKLEYYEVSPALANMINFAPKAHQDNVLDIVNKVQAAIYRSGTTGLAVRSYVNQWVKDTTMAYAMGGVSLTKLPPNVAMDMTKMLMDEKSAEELSTFYKADEVVEGMSGDDIAEYYANVNTYRLAESTETQQYKKIAKGNKAQSTGYYRPGESTDRIYDKIQDKWSKFVDFYNKPSEARETMLRRTVYQNAFNEALSGGKTTKQADEIARFLSDNATTNFNRALLHFNNYASTVPYLKSAINGTKSFWRVFEIDPLGVTTRIATGIMAPTVFMTVNNLGSEENRKIYKNIPQYVKEGNMIFIHDGTYETIPYPEEIANLMNPVRHAIESMAGAAPASFAELMANDIVGFLPVDFSGFTSLDISKVQTDGTQSDDRAKLGWSRLASGTMPVLAKSALMYATGVDPYTGKSIRKDSVYIDEDGNEVIMDSNTGALANALSNVFGDNMSAAMAQKLGEGTFGRALYGIADSLAGICDAVFNPKANQDSFASIINNVGEQTVGKLVDEVTSPFTGPLYNIASSEYASAIGQLKAEKEAMLNSKEMQTLVKAIGTETDSAKLENLRAQRDSMVNEFNQKVLNMVQSFRKNYPDMPFSYAKFGSALQLMNMNQNATAQGIYQESALASNLSDEEKRLYKARAYNTMVKMGFPTFEGPELFGQLQRSYNKETGRYDGPIEVTWRDPLAILELDSAKSMQADIHKANLQSIAKYGGWSAKKNAYQEQKNAIYNSKSKLTSSDYDKIDQIQAQENADYMKDIAEYINSVTPDAVINNSVVLDYLSDYIKPLSSTVGYVKNTTNIKGSKSEAFVRNYIKAIYKVNDTGYAGGTGDWSGRGQWWKQ